MVLNRKLTRLEKLKAAKAVSEYCLEVWKKTGGECNIFLSISSSGKSLCDILEPFIGKLPPISDPRRNYWVSTKYEITRIAYEDYLKSQQLWIQSLPYIGIRIRENPPAREYKRLVANIQRLVNHALELETGSTDPFLPLSIREQYRINRNIQMDMFLSVKDAIDINELELDDETVLLFQKLKKKVRRYLT